jgi:hypothetical protein
MHRGAVGLSTQFDSDEDRHYMAQLVTLCKALGVSRDYRKECWIGAFNAALSCENIGTEIATECADNALKQFDKTFSPL